MQQAPGSSAKATSEGLKFLTPREIIFIDELLDSVGEFGEVRLEVKNRKLRFASRTESIDPLKYKGDREKPGASR